LKEGERKKTRMQKYSLAMVVILLLVGVCRTGEGGEVSGRVVGQEGAGIAQAVVFVLELPAGVPPSKSAGSVEMDQIRREFVPHLLPIAAGTEVRFPNYDQIHHHVYSFSRTKNFELPLYKGEDAAPVLFDKPGVVRIGCNIHDWMSAIIFVAPTSYFTVSDESGAFVLSNLPAGSYAIAAWHEFSQDKIEDATQRVQVGEQPASVTFSLSLAQRRARLTPRKGGPY